MPNRDPMKCEEPACRPARRERSGQGRREEDTTGRGAHDCAVMSTPEGRKSTRDERRAVLLEGMGVPAPWKRLGDVLSEVAS